MRLIDADALIVDMQERYCKPCKEKGEDYHEVRCRACWVDDAIGDVDGFADNSIDIARCKECVKRMRDDCPMCNGCKLERVPTEDDDFCSYGERREP